MRAAGTVVSAVSVPMPDGSAFTGTLAASPSGTVTISQESGARTRSDICRQRAVQRARYMTLETIAPLSDDPFVKLPTVAA
jgi:hypothetical protein